MSDVYGEPDLNATYVHDGSEVRLTGRQAKKSLRNSRTLFLYEIKPVDPMFDIKKWVPMSDLYLVEEMKTHK